MNLILNYDFLMNSKDQTLDSLTNEDLRLVEQIVEMIDPNNLLIQNSSDFVRDILSNPNPNPDLNLVEKDSFF